MTESARERTRGSPVRLLLRVVMGVVWVGTGAWVISLVVGQIGTLRDATAPGPLAMALLVGAVGYSVLTCAFLATPWWWLLGVFRNRPALLAGIEVWARTQVGRYLPGNVAHYLGRQVLGRRVGVGHHELIGASLLELISIVASAVLVMAAFPLLDLSLLSGPVRSIMPAAAALVLVGFLAWPLADRLARRTPRLRDRIASLPKMSVARFAGLMLPAVAMHTAFLCGTGLLFWLITIWGWPEAGRVSVAHAIRAYALAWTIGTLAPGVPAGAGVREAVIVQDLGPIMGEGESAAAAIALRVATMSGDMLTFVVGWALRTARSSTDTQ